MTDKKISSLTASSTPLAGTEVLPIVQSGTTVKVSVSNLTAGRAVDALSLTASETATAAKFISLSGTTASIGSGIPVTLFSTSGDSVWIVNATIAGTGAPAAFTAVALIKSSGGTALATTLFLATGIAITATGVSVQATQISGAAQVMTYSAIRIF